MRWTVSRYADLIPLLAFLVVMGGVTILDRERGERAEADRRDAANVAQARAASLADELGNELSERVGSLTAAELQFTSLEDSLSQRSFMMLLDSVTRRMSGLMAISVIYPSSGRVLAPDGSLLRGRSLEEQDTAIRRAYVKSLGTRALAATGVLDHRLGRRILVFRPVERGDSTPGILVAELEPHMVYRAAAEAANLDAVSRGYQFSLFGPNGVPITARVARPPGWQAVRRPVRVADTEWQVLTAYEPPNPQIYRAERIAIWVAGTALALAISLILLFLRRTIMTQKDEIARRQAAEEAARTAAAEARQHAREARELAAQLEAAQRASQRLSTSLDPNDVLELFLGGVAEILDADVASLYTFEEEGELVVGRKRMVFRDVPGITDRFRREDIGQIRAPVALLPHLAEPVATGEPYVQAADAVEARGLALPGGEPTALISVPLMIAGHTVGVATWEVYSGPARFSDGAVAFSQALAAPAAAALRTAELFASLEAERQRAAREALRFAAVLDQMADGVIVVDANGRMERSNASAEELLGEDLGGAPIEQWPARYDLATVEGRPLPAAEFPLARAIRGERVRRSNFIIKNAWGTERHVSSSAGPILNAGGQLTGAAMVLRDVTDEHQYAEMLRHTNRELRRQAEMLEEVNRQLREATKAKDQFLAVMSHELRTPINAIMGYSDLLDLGIKGPLNEDQRAMLSRVRETSRHLLGLINEVLDLAKIGSGRMELVIAELEVHAIIDRAVQQILPLAAGKGLRLEVDVDPAIAGVTVTADETRLTQIIINLLSNAVKFTPHGEVRISYAVRGPDVEITVCDTGPGISPELQDRIFEEFYQVEGGLSRATGGTGLGLAIARRFARLMGGDIRVESSPGEGSRFIVRLPGPGLREDGAEPGAPSVVALLHSDRAVKRLQQDLGGTVSVVGTSDHAAVATLARQEHAAAVAIDARAARSGGWLALSSLQADRETADVLTLLFAHEGDEGEIALDLGLFHTLAKPLYVEHARDLICAAYEGGTRAPEHVLIADPDRDVRRILSDALASVDCRVSTVQDGGQLLRALAEDGPDVLVMDLLSPAMGGVEVLAQLQTDPAQRDLPIVVLLNPELSPDDLERLDRAVSALSRGRRARAVASGELVRRALARGRRERAFSTR